MTTSLFDEFRAVMMETANGSRKEAQDAFIERMKADPDNFEALARDYFDRMAAVWTVRSLSRNDKSFGRTEVAADRSARLRGPRDERPAKPIELVRRTREEAALRTERVFEEMRANIRNVVLLDMPMPNGKLLRDSTGADCVKAGGFYAAVGKAIKPQQVVDRQLTEGDLQNIRARYYQSNSDAA